MRFYSLRSISLAVGVATLCGFGAFADIALEGETEYAVSSGTQTVGDRLTGTGSIKKTGGGTLVLANAANDYSGGTLVVTGIVEATKAGALGTGDVTVRDRGSQIRFSCAATGGFAEFANNINLNGEVNTGLAKDDSLKNSNDGSYDIYFYKNTKLTGTVTASRGIRMRHEPVATSLGSTGASAVLMGCVSVPDHRLFVDAYGTMTFSNRVVAKEFFFGDAWSAGGIVELCSPENAFGTCYVDTARVRCTAANVLGGGIWSWHATGTDVAAGYMSVDLQGHDQTIAGLSFVIQALSGWGGGRVKSGDFNCFKSTKPATLTISGTNAAQETWATLRGAISLDFNPANYPSYEQTFRYNNSTFTGSTTVRKGTLILDQNARFSGTTAVTVEEGANFVIASTNALPALEGVKTLVVNGTLDASTARVNPFSGTLTKVTFGANGVLKLPPNTSFAARTVEANGGTHASALLTPTYLPQLQGEGVFLVVSGTPAAANWTGAGEDEKLSTVANWSVAEPDLVLGSMKPTFATAGVRAVVDVDAVFAGLDFSAANGFALARAEGTPKTLTVLGDIAASGTTPATYVIDNPLRIVGDHALALSAGQRLVLKDALAADDAAAGVLTVTGSNLLTFQGDNTLAGALRTGVNRVTVTGTLASPGHVYEGRSTSDKNIVYLNLQDTGGSNGNEGSGICLSNAVVEKAICVNNRIGSCSVYAPSGTTNEIKGYVLFENSSHERFSLYSKSLTVLSGGLETIHSFRVYKGGTLLITNTPALFLGSSGLNPDEGTVILAVAHNTITNMCLGYGSSKVTVETTVDYAMTNGNVQVGGNGGSFSEAVALSSGTFTLNLHATRQKCQRLGVMKQGILTGVYPAMLEVTEGRPDSGLFAKDGYSINGQVTGGVGLHLSGAGTLEFKAKTFASAGDLEVSNGTMSFLAGATWRNGTNVTVRGAGTLKLARSDVFDGGKAVLHLGADGDAWTIDIPTGQCAAFSWAYDANGNLLPSGTYGATGTTGVTQTRYAAHVTGGGSFRVRHHGTQILLR